MANLSFNYSGEWADVCHVLRCFSTDTILKRISTAAIALQKESHGVKWVEYDLFDTVKRTSEKKKSVITLWGLIDLAYYTVVVSNDYRGKRTITDEEFYMLFDAVESMKQKKEKEFLDAETVGSRELLMYLWGFSGEQFKVQEQNIIFESAGRELYILFELSKKVPDASIDISSIVQNEIGMTWEKVLCGLMLGWVFSTMNCCVTKTTCPFNDPELISREEYLKVISHYSITYEMLRKSKLKRQALYTKPYIITQKNETLGMIPFLNLCLYEHAILWIVRDYFNYKKEQDQWFTSYFGKCFEKYFEELLNCSLREDEYEKIPEATNRRADWKMKIDGYRFLVEQKSTLIRLNAKQQAPSIGDIEYFAKQTLIKAIGQLDTTEKEFAEGQFIKIILLYDDYLNPEILEQVFTMKECDTESDNHFWLVTIEEMEILLSLCPKNRDSFDSIIEEKNRREIAHSKDGKTLFQIMRKQGVLENDFLKREGIAYYRDLALEKIRHFMSKTGS